MAKRAKKKAAPKSGGKYGEPSQGFGVRLPNSACDLLDKIGPNRSEALTRIVFDCVQYRFLYGKRGPLFPESQR